MKGITGRVFGDACSGSASSQQLYKAVKEYGRWT